MAAHTWARSMLVWVAKPRNPHAGSESSGGTRQAGKGGQAFSDRGSLRLGVDLDGVQQVEHVEDLVSGLGLQTPNNAASAEQCRAIWGFWGFSVLEVPDGDYHLLARQRPVFAASSRSDPRLA